MEPKFIDDPVRLQTFPNKPGSIGNIVEPGYTYYIKPDAVYLGIYEGLVLTGIHEVRSFWHSAAECHAVYDPGFRGGYALRGHRLLYKWPLENSPFLSSVTMTPDIMKCGRLITRLLGATRVGRLADAYIRYGKSVDVTLYQLTRQQYEKLSKR